MTAACVNTAVGVTAYLYSRISKDNSEAGFRPAAANFATPAISLGAAAVLAGLCGFVALGFEIAWFRVFSIASSDRAPAFAAE